MHKLILVGGGGHCKSVIDAALSAGFDIRGILDLECNIGKKVLDFEIIGSDNDIPRFVSDCDFVVTLGFIKNPEPRISLHNRILDAGGRLASVVASTAHVSRFAEIGEGTTILHGASVNAGASIGKGCIINTNAVVEHDASIGNFCHISTGAIVNGDCRVGENTFIGSQSVMVNGISVPSDSIFGAGSVIHKSISRPGLYLGNPATLKTP